MKHHRIRIRGLIILALALALLAGTLVFLRIQDDASYREPRGSMTDGFGELKTVNWGGAIWREKPAVTTILIGGIDQETRTDSGGRVRYQNGGQADLLMLVAIDHTEKKIHQLQIDRDTMAEITILGVYGNETGTRELQICLAHSFGARPEDNARYTVRAVRKLMNDLEIDGYYMVDYSSVPALTELLGGVPVTIDEDMTSVNPEWYKGHTITLHGKDAEAFVRTRKTVGSGTNAERMNRQAVYLRSVTAGIHQKLSENAEFASEMMATLHSIAVTDLPDKKLLEEIREAASYEVLPVDRLQGHYEPDDSGFIAFYPDTDSAAEWIMKHLYSIRQ